MSLNLEGCARPSVVCSMLIDVSVIILIAWLWFPRTEAVSRSYGIIGSPYMIQDRAQDMEWDFVEDFRQNLK